MSLDKVISYKGSIVIEFQEVIFTVTLKKNIFRQSGMMKYSKDTRYFT